MLKVQFVWLLVITFLLPISVEATTILQASPNPVAIKQNEAGQIQYNWIGTPMPVGYRAFVHFINSSGRLISYFNDDHALPVSTKVWDGNVSYSRTLNVPAGMPTGRYKITAGLFDSTGANPRPTLDMGPGVTQFASTEYVIAELEVLPGTDLPPSPTVPPAVGAPTGGKAGVLYGDPLPATPYVDDYHPTNYQLTFHDEFEGTALKTGTWINTYAWGDRTLSNNGEKECYLESNVSVSGGSLFLTAKNEPVICPKYMRVQPYTSGLINSQNAFTQTYGYFVMKARLPYGKGMWPAFWMLPKNASWPPEIDIIEMLGHEPRIAYTTFHFINNGHKSTHAVTDVGDMSQGYFTYAVDWQPGSMIWYINGVEVKRFESSFVPNIPMYLLANLAVGGYWPGNPGLNTIFPQSMEIDYIRAYKKPASTMAVAIDSHTEGQEIVADSEANLSAAITGAVGTVNVDLYVGSEKICTVSAAPYACAFRSPTTAGALALKAVATEVSTGLVKESTVNVTVILPTSNMTAKIIAPVDGSVMKRAFWTTLTGSVQNAAYPVSVDYFVNGVKHCTVTSAPYNCSYLTPKVEATVTVKMVATEAVTQAVREHSISFTTRPLLVAINEPAEGQEFVVDTDITTSATIANAARAVTVDFFLGDQLLCTVSAAPYTCAFRAPAQAGAVSLRAVATESATNIVAEATRSLTIIHPPTTMQVGIIAPKPGQILPINFWTTLTGSVKYNTSPVTFSFYVNGVKFCTKTSAPYNCSYHTPSTAQDITIKAVATEAGASGSASSAEVTFRVQ